MIILETLFGVWPIFLLFMDLTILILYFGFLLGVGVVFGRMVKNSDDYFKAGSQGTWWLVGASMFMAGISAYTFVGNAVGIYQSGWSPLAIYAANVIAFIIGGLGVAAIYRQMRVVTVAEVLKARFGKSTEQIVATLVVANNLIWSGIVLYGLSIFSQLLFPNSESTTVIIGVGLIVLVYCTVGGNWAVMANDFVQGLILVSMTVLLAVLCIAKTGGIGGFTDAIQADAVLAKEFKLLTPLGPEDGFWQAKYGLTWVIAAFFGQFVAQLSLFQGVRYFAAKHGRAANQSSMLAGVLMAVGCVVFFIPPMYARLFLEPEVMAMAVDPLKAPEFSYAVVSQELLPNGLFSIMVVAMFAAAVSSMDTGLNRNAALIVRDLLPGLFKLFGKKRLAPEKEVFAGRVSTLTCGIVIILLALYYAAAEGVTIFDMMLNISAMFMAPQMIPLLLLLVVKRTAWWAALSAIGAGFLPSLLDFAFDFGWSYQVKTFIISGSSMAGFLIAVPFYKHSTADYRTRTEALYRKMSTPVDFATEVGESSDGTQMRIIGQFGTVLGCLLSLLLFLPNEPWGRLCIGVVVGFVLSISVCLWLLGRRALNRTD